MRLDVMNGIIGAAVTGFVLVSATVLAWHGTINGEAIVGVYTAVLSGGLVAGASHVAAKQGARAALAQKQDDLNA